jgi:regulator of sigma E protease
MDGFITSALAFVVAISILVAVHEYGHFWVARRLGIKVLRFSVGFGRPFWSRRGADGTEYCLAAIPLGGYVKLLDERDCEVAPEDLPRAFNRASPGRRVAVLLAGPAFNFIFAVIAYWAMFVSGVPATKPLVGAIESGSPAAEAELRRNDLIVAVEGVRTETMLDAFLGILEGIVDDGAVELTLRNEGGIERVAVVRVEGDTRALTEPGALMPGLGISQWQPVIPPVLGEVSAGGSAAASGLRPGDRVVSADGQPVDDWMAWVDFIRERPGRRVDLTIERDGAVREMELVIGEADEEGRLIGRIGAAPRIESGLWDPIRTEQHYGPLPAIPRAFEQTWRMTATTLSLLVRMITGDVSFKHLSGPLTIAEGAGISAMGGAASFLNFLALVSLSLGIINLMPIPLLDGGQIVYQVAEVVKGSPLSERAQLIGQQVGLVMLLMLMGFAFYNDIVRLAN